MSGYADMLPLGRPDSSRPKMPRQERAKQFAPFAALAGFDAVVHERDRVLVPAIVQTEESREQLNEKLRRLRKDDQVTVIYFVPVRRSAEETLGEYVTVTDTVKKLDEYRGVLNLAGVQIPLEQIGKLFTTSEKKDCTGQTNAV